MKVGRQPIYDPEELAVRLRNYIEETDDPMVEEFCGIKGNPTKDTVYRLEKECKSLSDAIKELHAKQHVRTVRLAEQGQMPTAWAIFKMKQKQYGWTDKQEVEISQEKPFEVEIKIVE